MRTSTALTRAACIGVLCVLMAATRHSVLGQAAVPVAGNPPAAQVPPPPAPSTEPANAAPAASDPTSSQAAASQPAASQPATPNSAISPAEEAAADTAIRGIVADFEKDYNAGDAKALESLFIPDGEIIAADGAAHQGRDEIEGEFADIFKQHPKSTIKDEIQSIRLLTPNLAVEEGTCTVTFDPEQPPERTRYEAIHVKQNGQWRMASARDLPDEELSGVDQLQQLHWLIGDWVDESADSVVHTSYRWSDDHHYILGDYAANIEGHLAIKGTQRIGWDPLRKTIHSWSFDSEGGFVEGTWTREGNQWMIKATGVTAEGKPASSTNYLTHLHKHRMTWESRDRLVGGEKTPDLGPITIARQPPAPGISTQPTPVKK